MSIQFENQIGPIGPVRISVPPVQLPVLGLTPGSHQFHTVNWNWTWAEFNYDIFSPVRNEPKTFSLQEERSKKNKERTSHCFGLLGEWKISRLWSEKETNPLLRSTRVLTTAQPFILHVLHLSRLSWSRAFLGCPRQRFEEITHWDFASQTRGSVSFSFRKVVEIQDLIILLLTAWWVVIWYQYGGSVILEVYFFNEDIITEVKAVHLILYALLHWFLWVIFWIH